MQDHIKPDKLRSKSFVFPLVMIAVADGLCCRHCPCFFEVFPTRNMFFDRVIVFIKRITLMTSSIQYRLWVKAYLPILLSSYIFGDINLYK